MTSIYLPDQLTRALAESTSAVSLHSHTSLSCEDLHDLPRYAARVPGLLKRMPKSDYSPLYWTPPLTPVHAWQVENSQIQNLGLVPLVSITDHNSIDAATRLRFLDPAFPGPLSFEWTVHVGPTFLHLGIHNLPWPQGTTWLRELVSASRSGPEKTSELLAALHSMPSVLTVLNHPLWDEPGIGTDPHRKLAQEFIARNGRWIHALEFNGLRPWKENSEVLQLARWSGHPVLAGGDRHGLTPNCVLNLTPASSFEEFVDEVRHARRSRILLRPFYLLPYWLRWVRTAAEILDYYPWLSGREHWWNRVYWRGPQGPQPLGLAWTEWFPRTSQYGLEFLFLLSRLFARGPALRQPLLQTTGASPEQP